ncbi:MAG: putative Ig domain-containing protein [Acidobacteriota bacterium]
MSTGGVITGTPGAGDLGGSPYTVIVTASDPNSLAISDTFALVINGRPDIVSTLADLAVEIGTPVNVDVASSFDDPEGDALSFIAGGLPPTLSLSNDGVLSGTPDVNDLVDSPFIVTVTAVDPFGATVDDAFNLEVLPGLFADGFESGDTSAWDVIVP